MPNIKLQKQLSRKVGEKEYPKWAITIPPKQIRELDWSEGEFLESEINNQELIIRRKGVQKVKKRREVVKKAWTTRKKGGR